MKEAIILTFISLLSLNNSYLLCVCINRIHSYGRIWTLRLRLNYGTFPISWNLWSFLQWTWHRQTLLGEECFIGPWHTPFPCFPHIENREGIVKEWKRSLIVGENHSTPPSAFRHSIPICSLLRQQQIHSRK